MKKPKKKRSPMEKMVLELRKRTTQNARFAGELAAEMGQRMRRLEARVDELEGKDHVDKGPYR